MTIQTENPKAKPSKALSRDEKRPILRLGHLVERDGRLFLEATDSYQAVRVPLSTNGDPAPDVEYLPAAAVKVLDGPRGALEFEGGIVARGRDGETLHYDEPQDVGRFPDLDSLLPRDAKQPFRVGINVGILRALAEGLGAEKVELVFDLAHKDSDHRKGYVKGIYVRSLSGAGEGALMPVRIDP